MNEHEFPHEPLSAGGQARRAEILGKVLAASASRRRRRIAGQSLAVAAPLVLVAVVAWAVQQRPTPHLPADTNPVVATVPTRESPPSAIRLVSTDSSLVARWSVPERSLAATRLDDSELFSILSSEGRATGMVRAGHTVTVVGLTPDDPPKPSGHVPGQRPLIYTGIHRTARPHTMPEGINTGV